MTSLEADVRDIMDAISSTTIIWATPHMRTKTGSRLWYISKDLLLRAYKAESQLTHLRPKFESENNSLRELCSVLTSSLQDLEEKLNKMNSGTINNGP